MAGTIVQEALEAHLQAHDIASSGTGGRTRLQMAVEYGNATNWWIEYPDGLIDLSRSAHLSDVIEDAALPGNIRCSNTKGAPDKKHGQIDIEVDGNKRIRLDAKKSALLVVDMQNFFLHPQLCDHPRGMKCVGPLLKTIPYLRAAGIKIVWVNWGLTPHELDTVPPSLARSFAVAWPHRNGLGGELDDGFGPALMRGAKNSELIEPLQKESENGRQAGTDVWIHKNRMSAIWGPQSALDLYLQEEGIQTLFVSGVDTDKCVLGTIVDAYYRGYDIILIRDATATTTLEGGLENVCYSVGNSYGFITDSESIVEGIMKK